MTLSPVGMPLTQVDLSAPEDEDPGVPSSSSPSPSSSADSTVPASSEEPEKNKSKTSVRRYPYQKTEQYLRPWVGDVSTVGVATLTTPALYVDAVTILARRIKSAIWHGRKKGAREGSLFDFMKKHGGLKLVVSTVDGTDLDENAARQLEWHATMPKRPGQSQSALRKKTKIRLEGGSDEVVSDGKPKRNRKPRDPSKPRTNWKKLVSSLQDELRGLKEKRKNHCGEIVADGEDENADDECDCSALRKDVMKRIEDGPSVPLTGSKSKSQQPQKLLPRPPAKETPTPKVGEPGPPEVQGTDAAPPPPVKTTPPLPSLPQPQLLRRPRLKMQVATAKTATS